ncbi:YdaS family helix-turn-helix protein [Sphingomonas jatrophae]|uniref:transcriptional regulator n=1 Tax=Sphingomonas jatrophae TaxID=1166337 RepID=UPI000B83D887
MEALLTPAEAFEKAVRIADGQSAAGRLTGVSQSAIHQRLRAKKGCRAEDVLVLEENTGVSRHNLRPDIYPPHPARQVCPSPAEQHVGDGAPVVPCVRSARLQHAGGAKA